MNNEWKTPDDLYEKLDREFGFTIDLCTDGTNSKCETGLTEVRGYHEHPDCIKYTDEVYWMNPPYSRDLIGPCMEEAAKISELGRTVVCLVRFDPSAQWFQKYVDGVADEVRMLNKRVKFKGAASAYNFPCCVVIYGCDKNLPLDYYRTWYHIWGWVDAS